MNEENECQQRTLNKRFTILLYCFSILPVVVGFLGESHKTHLVGLMRIVDFLDLVVLAPFFLGSMLFIQHSIFRQQPPSRASWAALLSIFLFLYGQAMHLTANAINTFATEIRHYRHVIPDDAYALIFFFDEDLGHWLLCAGLFGALGLWSFASDLHAPHGARTALAGVVAGAGSALAIIESSHPVIAPLGVGFVAACCLMAVRRTGSSLGYLMSFNPMVQFSIWNGVSTLATLLLYYIYMGSFIEPSKINLIET